MDKYEVKIKCGGCNKNKSQVMFSGTALKKWQSSRRNPNQPVKSINCMACSAGNREELQCSMCSRTMALDKFARAQRRKNDDAHCVDCSQEKQDREADFEKEVKEIEIIGDLKREQSIVDSQDRLSKMSDLERSRAESAHSRLETETNPGSIDYAHGNDAVSLVSSGSSAYSSNNTRPITGTSWDNFEGMKRTITSSSGSKTGFAKQNAVPMSPRDKAAKQIEREKRRNQEQDEVVRDESDDDSDDDGLPY